MVRFADDMVFVFQHTDDAKRFYKVLPKRLEKFGLKLHEEKSGIIQTGSKTAVEAHAKGDRIPTYKFLGFTCYWGKGRYGRWRLKYKTRSDRFASKLSGLRQYLKSNLNKDTNEIITSVKRIVTGWKNYNAISDNQGRVGAFIQLSKRAIFKWINRKGGKRKMCWEKFVRLLKQIKFPERFKTISMFQSC